MSIVFTLRRLLSGVYKNDDSFVDLEINSSIQQVSIIRFDLRILSCCVIN